MSATARPPANSIALSELRDEHSDVLGRVTYGKERVVLTRYGRPIAVLVPLEDWELLEALDDRVDADAANLAYNDPANVGEPVAWKDIKTSRGL